jgi:hypothetical protein
VEWADISALTLAVMVVAVATIPIVVTLNYCLYNPGVCTLPRPWVPWQGGPGAGAGAGDAPNWDLPWSQIGRNLARLAAELVTAATAACAATSVALNLATRFVGKNSSDVCSGKAGPVFMTGLDTPAATGHDMEALILHPTWAQLAHTSRKLGAWYYNVANTPNDCTRSKDDLASMGKASDGMNCDEFPFGSTAEGGPGASLKLIDGNDNKYQGSLLSSFYGYGQNGCGIPTDSGEESKFLVVPVPAIPTLWTCRK